MIDLLVRYALYIYITLRDRMLEDFRVDCI